MIKKIMSICFITIITLGVLVAPVSAETSLISVEEYEQYLKENSIETYSQFVMLSKNDKEKTVKLLSVPDVWLGESDDPNVEYSEEQENNSLARVLMLRASDKSSWHEQYVHIFGLKILGIKSEIGYKTSGGNVTQINYHNTYVTVNLNPLLQISKDSQSSWIGGNGKYAVGRAVFKASFGVSGLSSQFKTARSMFYVYESGKKEFSFN
ncbi:hypothetical protein [Erysipelothrix anatis]|uniref:hypothetical protein n=1 Tax=Erysipelothrix anatis TaxID=2683713 RepID=UPI00135A49CB|nr:hypothetical protein [Erysipelothrix anatis]